ncbi:MAG: tyrosine-protein phosphatase [Anaerolineales bacterium]|nr:tyrosine-protein phosphatase [Anaerolineales bacterium]
MSKTYASRHLAWEGCLNARDLGGIPTGDGSATQWQFVIRADCVGRLSRRAGVHAATRRAHHHRHPIATRSCCRTYDLADSGQSPATAPYRSRNTIPM